MSLYISPEELAWDPVNGMARYERARRAVTGRRDIEGEIRRKVEAQIKARNEAAVKAEMERAYLAELEEILKAEQERRTREIVAAEFVAMKQLEREEESRLRIMAETITRYICAKYDMRWIDIKSARRTADIVLPRQIIIYLLRQHTVRSLPEIGRLIGGRDHTTALHAYRKIKQMIAQGKVSVPCEVDLLTFQAMRANPRAGE